MPKTSCLKCMKSCVASLSTSFIGRYMNSRLSRTRGGIHWSRMYWILVDVVRDTLMRADPLRLATALRSRSASRDNSSNRACSNATSSASRRVSACLLPTSMDSWMLTSSCTKAEPTTGGSPEG